MRTELPDELVRFDGAPDLVSTPDGRHPRRLPAWTRARLADPVMDLVVDASAGVRLALRTAAETIALDVKVTRVTAEAPETGRIRALGSPGRGALTVERVRALPAGIVETRDDPALRYLDGRELLGPDEADASLPDGLHPDAEANLRTGERAAHLLLGLPVGS